MGDCSAASPRFILCGCSGFIQKHCRIVYLSRTFIAYGLMASFKVICVIETNKVKVSLTLLVQICNALDITVDYLLENEYHNPTSVVEKELLNTIKDMNKEKQETLLRIAKVL